MVVGSGFARGELGIGEIAFGNFVMLCSRSHMTCAGYHCNAEINLSRISFTCTLWYILRICILQKYLCLWVVIRFLGMLPNEVITTLYLLKYFMYIVQSRMYLIFASKIQSEAGYYPLEFLI